jgi:hypothetical protein
MDTPTITSQNNVQNATNSEKSDTQCFGDPYGQILQHYQEKGAQH